MLTCQTHDDVHTIADWVYETTGRHAETCIQIHDVIVHARVGHVAVLFVDIDMSMEAWWHLDDVMMAEEYTVFQLSWRDVEHIDDPYYAKTLIKMLTRELKESSLAQTMYKVGKVEK